MVRFVAGLEMLMNLRREGFLVEQKVAQEEKRTGLIYRGYRPSAEVVAASSPRP